MEQDDHRQRDQPNQDRGRVAEPQQEWRLVGQRDCMRAGLELDHGQALGGFLYRGRAAVGGGLVTGLVHAGSFEPGGLVGEDRGEEGELRGDVYGGRCFVDLAQPNIGERGKFLRCRAIGGDEAEGDRFWLCGGGPEWERGVMGRLAAKGEGFARVGKRVFAKEGAAAQLEDADVRVGRENKF